MNGVHKFTRSTVERVGGPHLAPQASGFSLPGRSGVSTGVVCYPRSHLALTVSPGSAACRPYTL